MEETHKNCKICGADCTNRRYSRDIKGRYHCRECWDRVMGQLAMSRTFETPAEKPVTFGAQSLKDEPEAMRAPPRVLTPRGQRSLCPACGKAMIGEATVCVSCGFDTQTGHHVDVRTARANAPIPPRDHAAWFMAPVFLFARPSRFFKQFVVEPAPLLTAFFAWMYGMAGVMDRIDTRAAMSQFGSNGATIPDSWVMHWGIIAIGGVLAGLLYSSLGGWWYRLRLRWCAVPNPDWAMVRRVYLTSAAVFALPAVVWRGIQTGMYDKPSHMQAAGINIGDVLVMLTLLLSVWISYVGVRTVFDAMRWRAMILFLGLPGMLYGVAIGTVAIVTLMLSAAPPAIKAPLTHSAPSFTFDYPSNWDIDRFDPMFNPAANLSITAPQWAAVHIMAYDAEGEAEDHLAWTIDGMRQALSNSHDNGRFAEWGTLRGVGRIIRGEHMGVPSTVRMFVSEVEDGSFIEIAETCPDHEHSIVEPGFALIRSTFQVR